MPRITLVLVIGGTLGCGPAAATDDGATAATREHVRGRSAGGAPRRTWPLDQVVLFAGRFLDDRSSRCTRARLVNVVAHQRVRKRVADNLKRIIEQRDVEKKALAKSARMSRNTLDRILDAKSGASIDSLGRLADALGVELAELVS